jgi:hypothetical protein
MRKWIGLVLSLMLLSGTLLGGLSACGSDRPSGNWRAPTHDMRGEGPGTKH